MAFRPSVPAYSQEGEDELISGINVTPLVDVVLVLLVIFLMTAPILYQKAIQVSLPRAQTGEDTASSPLSFSLSRSGELEWAGKKFSWTELESALNQQKSQWTADSAASISADEGTAHGVVIRLMDALRKAGLSRFALNVQAGQPGLDSPKN